MWDSVLRSSVNQAIYAEGRHLIRLAILLVRDDFKVDGEPADQRTVRIAKRVSEMLSLLRGACERRLVAFRTALPPFEAEQYFICVEIGFIFALPPL